MKQSNFSLADLLTVLTALAFGFVCFLGKNFYTLGNISVSITWAAFIAVSLAGTAFAAKLLKRTSRSFKTSFILEIFALILFTGLTVFFAYSPFPHFFNVSAKKTEIQDKLQKSITQAKNMFAGYELYVENRENFYEGKLNTVIAAKASRPNDYAGCGLILGSMPDDNQKANKMFTIHTLLFPPNYSDSISKSGIKEVATEWLAKAKTTTNSWKPIGIVNVVNDVEKNSVDWKNQLIGFSQQVNIDCEKSDPYNYPLNIVDVKTHFTALGKPTPLSIGLAAGAYLLMLLSYLISKRSSKTTIGTTKEKGEYDIDF